MPGKPRRPTKLKELQGNPGRRPLNKDEPEFEGIATCPDWLSGVAKVEWRRVAPLLVNQGLLTAADTQNLAGYCHWYARWREAEAFIKKNGAYDKKGQRTGASIMSKDAFVTMQKTAALFGFSPSDRTRLHVTNAPKKTTLDAILDGDFEEHASIQ